MKKQHFIPLLLGMMLFGGIFISIRNNNKQIQANILSAFIDVDSSHKYFKPIQFLRDHNVVVGYGDGSFKPDTPLTRAELMKIIILGSRLDIPMATSSPFSDVPLGEWYTDYVIYGADKDYIQGYPDGTFRPNQEVNKVEALKIIGSSTLSEPGGAIIAELKVVK